MSARRPLCQPCITTDNNNNHTTKSIIINQIINHIINQSPSINNNNNKKRGAYMVNWSPKLGTAVSDLEVEYSEEPGFLYHFR